MPKMIIDRGDKNDWVCRKCDYYCGALSIGNRLEAQIAPKCPTVDECRNRVTEMFHVCMADNIVKKGAVEAP